MEFDGKIRVDTYLSYVESHFHPRLEMWVISIVPCHWMLLFSLTFSQTQIICWSMICNRSCNGILSTWTVYRKGCFGKEKMLIYFVYYYYYAFIVSSDMNIMPKICITNKLYKKNIRTSKVKCRHLAQTGWPILRCCCELLKWDFFYTPLTFH